MEVSVNEFLNGHYNGIINELKTSALSFSERIPKWPLQRDYNLFHGILLGFSERIPKWPLQPTH